MDKQYPRMEACRKFVAENEWARYGQAHIIVDDYNTDDHWIDGTIERLEKLLAFLRHLKTLPKDDYGEGY